VGKGGGGTTSLTPSSILVGGLGLCPACRPPSLLFDTAVTMAPVAVPETVLRKRRRDEEWAAKKATAAAEVGAMEMGWMASGWGGGGCKGWRWA
jgi:hypothetical protein